jgi:hypothetical protein
MCPVVSITAGIVTKVQQSNLSKVLKLENSLLAQHTEFDDYE